MDARGVQRTLERLQGLAESAEALGERSIETMLREPGLSDNAKQELVHLYSTQSLRLTLLYSEFGVSICDVLRGEAKDDTARGLIDLFHAGFFSLRDRARSKLEQMGAAPE